MKKPAVVNIIIDVNIYRVSLCGGIQFFISCFAYTVIYTIIDDRHMLYVLLSNIVTGYIHKRLKCFHMETVRFGRMLR